MQHLHAFSHPRLFAVKRRSATLVPAAKAPHPSTQRPPEQHPPTRLLITTPPDYLAHHRLVSRFVPPLLKVNRAAAEWSVDRPSCQNLSHLGNILLRITATTRWIQHAHRTIRAHLAL